MLVSIMWNFEDILAYNSAMFMIPDTLRCHSLYQKTVIRGLRKEESQRSGFGKQGKTRAVLSLTWSMGPHLRGATFFQGLIVL